MKGKRRKIAQYDSNDKLIRIWNSMKEIKDEGLVTKKGLIKACKLPTKIYKGYKWEYYIEKLEGEEWRNLLIDDRYIKVSSFGRVMIKTGYISYGSTKQCGYKFIGINRKSYRVHRLICTSFNPIKNDEFLSVNHRDNNKTNNNITNLEWRTHQENVMHAQQFKPDANKGGKRVEQLDDNGTVINVFISIVEASRQTHINVTSISKVCSGKQQRVGNCKWRYSVLI